MSRFFFCAGVGGGCADVGGGSGFIYIWSLNPDRANNRNSPVQLHASNKCTSYVRQISWMGKCLITYVVPVTPPDLIYLTQP